MGASMENQLSQLYPESDEDFIFRAQKKCALVTTKNSSPTESRAEWFERPDFVSFWQDSDIRLEYTARSDIWDIIELRDLRGRSGLISILKEINILLAQNMKSNHRGVHYVALSGDAFFIAFLKERPIDDGFSGHKETIIELFNLMLKQ